MRCVKAVLCISVQNVRKWLTDYRVWVIAALLFFVLW